MGRSPRMQYHCLSLADLPGTKVSFIGFGGEPCTQRLEDHDDITKVELWQPFSKLPRSMWLFWAPFKVIFQVIQLMWVLMFGIPMAGAVLVQNPPSIPSLAVARLATWVRGGKLVIDWHNFGYSILSHARGEGHPLVHVSRVYERVVGALGDDHFCVTAAMRDWLLMHWGIRARVLHDKAPSFFRRTGEAERHDLFGRLHAELAAGPGGGELFDAVPVETGASTLLTRLDGRGRAAARPDRPAVLLSSTSWTPDEDFSILLDALVAVNAAAEAEPTRFPPFLVLVTGKGPLKAHYERRIAALRLPHVAVRTLWLEAADYPRIVGCADLGVSLHVSTSGLDLPMKVVDMFGAGAPVCAVGFPCLGELVRHGDTGLVFGSAAELAEQVLGLFDGWPGKSGAGRRGAGRGGGTDARDMEALTAEEADFAVGASNCTREQRAEATRAAAADATRHGSTLLQLLAAGVARAREEDWAVNWTRDARPAFLRV